jgi:hypothetical protein
MLYAGSNLDKAQQIFTAAVEHSGRACCRNGRRNEKAPARGEPGLKFRDQMRSTSSRDCCAQRTYYQTKELYRIDDRHMKKPRPIFARGEWAYEHAPIAARMLGFRSIKMAFL